MSASGVGADPAKCQQVKYWLVPRDLPEVLSFVGLCLYYRRHIHSFTELAAPLYELATKGTDFEWTKRRDEAFNELKAALTKAPILGFPLGRWAVVPRYRGKRRRDGSGAVSSAGRGGARHRVPQQVARREQTAVLHGLQGTTGGGPSP